MACGQGRAALRRRGQEYAQTRAARTGGVIGCAPLRVAQDGPGVVDGPEARDRIRGAVGVQPHHLRPPCTTDVFGAGTGLYAEEAIKIGRSNRSLGAIVFYQSRVFR